MKLFEKLKAKNISFKNRIIMPPMATAKADENGHVSQDILDYYDEKTKDKIFSTVIVEHNFVDPLGKASHNQMSIANDSDIDGLKKLVKVIQNNDAQAIVRISHAGSSASKDVIGASPLAPSSLKNPSKKRCRITKRTYNWSDKRNRR